MSSFTKVTQKLSGHPKNFNQALLKTVSIWQIQPRAYYALSGLSSPLLKGHAQTLASAAQAIKEMVIAAHTGKSYSLSEYRALRTALISSQSAVTERVAKLSELANSEIPTPSLQQDDVLYEGEAIEVIEGSVVSSTLAFPILKQDTQLSFGGVGVRLPKEEVSFVVSELAPITMYVTYLDGVTETTRTVNTAYFGVDDSRDPSLYGVNASTVNKEHSLTFDQSVVNVSIPSSKGSRARLDANYNMTHWAASHVKSFIGGEVHTESYTQELSFIDSYVIEELPQRCLLIDGYQRYAVIDQEVSLIQGRIPASELISKVYTVRTESLTFDTEVLSDTVNITYTRKPSVVNLSGLYEGDALQSGGTRVIVNDAGQGATVSGKLSGKGVLVYSTKHSLLSAIEGFTAQLPSIPDNLEDLASMEDAYIKMSDVESYASSLENLADKLREAYLKTPVTYSAVDVQVRAGYDRAADMLRACDISSFMSLTEDNASYESALAGATRTLQVKISL
jgi:hypothetical protein